MAVAPESTESTSGVNFHRGWLFLAFLALIAIFFVFNRGAYKGYFPDDDLDNMGNARGIDGAYIVKSLLTPALNTANFRPAAFLYYFVMVRKAAFHFSSYIAVLHFFHLLNAWLLWCLARKLGLDVWQAGAAVFFFALHMAAFDIYWKPMYVFDLLCGTFALATLNLYLRGWLLMSILTFWLAFKCKEIVILFPVALAACEWMFGRPERLRWLKLLPFFAISLSFGLQALANNPEPGNNYHLQLTAAALWKTFSFYSSQWFLVPKLGLGVVLLLLFVKDARVRFGLLLLIVLSAPMLILPERLFAAYIYVPLIGLAIALGTLVRGKIGIAVALLFFAAWLPWDHSRMRANRKTALAAADEARAWVEAATTWATAHPAITTYLYDGAPVNMGYHGLRGSLINLNPRVVPDVLPAEGDLKDVWKRPNIALLVWDSTKRSLSIVERGTGAPDASYIMVGPAMPVWQFGSGWMAREGQYRWAKPEATARLHRPEGAREFEAVLVLSPAYLEAVKSAELTILLNGEEVAKRTFVKSGWLVERWPIPLRPAGPVEVTFRISPIFHPNAEDKTVEYGMPFAGFGFVTAGTGTSHAP